MQELFKKYSDLLKQWQSKINLISPNTINEIETRHIADSEQLAKFINPGATIFDLGSGAGFPAIVLGIMGYNVYCIESDMRKCIFLNECIRVMGLKNVVVWSDRIENKIPAMAQVISNLNVISRETNPRNIPISSGSADIDSVSRLVPRYNETSINSNSNPSEMGQSLNCVITARAFASLTKILDMTAVLGLNYALLKGENVKAEIDEAGQKYRFDYKLHESSTGPGYILLIKNVTKLG